MARISLAEFEQLAYEHVPFVGMLGIQVESLEAGRASIRMPFREDFIRPGGTVSGPVQMALADIVMYAVVLSQFPAPPQAGRFDRPGSDSQIGQAVGGR